jgi:hypothetical protein
MLRRGFTGLAGVSLLGVLVLLSIWASHFLPPGLWLNFSFHPASNVSLDCETNVILVMRVQPSGSPVLGPTLSDTSAVKDFIHEFGGLTAQQGVLYDTVVESAFQNTPEGRIQMYGTRTIYMVPYWPLLVIFAVLPAWRWLPPVVRWYESDSPRPLRLRGELLFAQSGTTVGCHDRTVTFVCPRSVLDGRVDGGLQGQLKRKIERLDLL